MLLRRLASTLLAVLACTTALAATIAERSPFLQGHWWDPSRSGNGFEIFNVGEQAMAIWYTYDEGGAPVWYTAQGTMVEPFWPLLKHRWVNGQRGPNEVVGSFRFTLRNPEAAQIAFDIRGQAGTWSIEPFHLSGVVNEVDHTGSYYDPTNSGWGLTVTHQGDVLGGVLYTYDASGAPTWYAGFDRGSQGTVNMITARGSCPTCAPVQTTRQSAGTLTFDFRGEREMILRSQLTGAMAAGVGVDGARIAQLGRPASSRRADRELAAFAADEPLKLYLDAGMRNLSAISSGIEFSPAPAPTAFSTTNLQEAGVDEADLVKTDGTLIYTFDAGAYGQQTPTIRVARIGMDGGAIGLVGSVPVTGGSIDSMRNAGLYVHGNQLVSITGTRAFAYAPWSLWAWSSSWTRGTTNIEIFQASPTALPTSIWHAQVDGHIVSSRRVGDRIYVVSRHVPFVEGFQYGATSAPALAANDQRLAATTLAAMLPGVRINGAARAPLVAAESVMLPPLGTRAPTADLVTVYAIDLATRRITQSLSVLGTAETVYASPTNLYVATSRFQYRTAQGVLLAEPGFYTTDVHQVRLGTDAMTLVGTGTVEGTLGFNPDKAAFRLGEHQGQLRVVSSSNVQWGGTVKNRVTVLQPSAVVPGLLKTVSFLPNAQRPEPLGKPGEVLYSTRFVGDRLYVVTFKIVDPLYVVDLSNSADPRIAGALEIPGFSEYLHPLPNGLMLGFGKDARPALEIGDGTFAWYQGLQLSLFDVNNPAQPRELQRVLIGKRGSHSPLLTTHHAFASLTRPGGALAIAIPALIHDGAAPAMGSGDSAYYPFLESGLLQFEVQGSGAADARLVQRPSLITHRAADYGQGYFTDPSLKGRSVIFPSGTVYVGNGRFWRQDATGGIVSGPF